ncbi:hypothetical protein [Frankia gtarii]|uniref:hypothetical protein n=1 Tax=Frankia gtarii TaxID=2950102 RepID=UPI0021BF9F00|nr:hypothetical protein [Frankia gtarii]
MSVERRAAIEVFALANLGEPLFLNSWRTVRGVLGSAVLAARMGPLDAARILVPLNVESGAYKEIDELWGLVGEWEDDSGRRGEYLTRIREFLIAD